MKHFKELTAAVLTLLATVAYAQDGEAPPVDHSDVNVLTNGNFTSFVTENPLVLAECKFAIPLLRLLYTYVFCRELPRPVPHCTLGGCWTRTWNEF